MADPSPEELRVLAQRVDALTESTVTRQEFTELKGLVQRLLDRLDQVVPQSEISDEHLAIMSAVFAATIGKRFRIKSVKTVVEPSGWAQAGRVNLHAQRHVRRS